MYERYYKRIFDLVFSIPALIVLSPVLLIVAILVRVKLGSPVIFRQERPGLNEKIFTMYKFRTMTDERDDTGELLPDEFRLPLFGLWLRSTSLDELPELWNVLRGDMSLVGPRPLLVQYLPLYSEDQRKRHLVRPGVTGYAQVLGRNTVGWQERFRLDTEYVGKVSFTLDLWIMYKTVALVLNRHGVSSGSSPTMEVFMGSEKGDLKHD